MKKLGFMVVAIALILCLSVSFAESVIDLGSYSNEELQSLYFSIKDEMSSRGIGRVGDLYEGTYIVGNDIAPGYYKITAPKSAYFYVFWNIDNYNAYLDLKSKEAITVDGQLVTEEDIYGLDLKEGYVVLVMYDYLRLEEMNNDLAE